MMFQNDNYNISAKDVLTKLFEAFSYTSKDSYVFLCYLDEDLSRWSKSAIEFFDLPGEYMYKAGEIWAKHIHPDDLEAYQQSIYNIMHGISKYHSISYRARAKDGNYVLCTCRGTIITGYDNTPKYFAGTIKNHGIQSEIDSITNIKNLYSFFNETSNLSLKNYTFGLIGVNNFSDLNDIYGYTFGNKILKEFAQILIKNTSNYGTLYRMEGTKFALCSKNLSIKDFEQKFKELKEFCRKGFIVENMKINLYIGGSGLNVTTNDINPHTLYSCLKTSYYNSLHFKQGEFVIFNDTLGDEMYKSLERLNTIRDCVANDFEGFFLCYQPVIDAKNGQLKGVEALVRWKSDEYGLVPPNSFIPVLEKDSTFSELGNWILKTAMNEIKPLLVKHPDLLVNINLSYTQLEKSDFLENVYKIIKETGFPAKNLCLEITERCRLLDMDLLISSTEVLKSYGIKFALDDFGTGFSSLNVLKKVPVDIIKIDREFVKDIEVSCPDQLIIDTVSHMCESLHLDLCVEGVENDHIADYLRRYPISSLQGYLYSKPIPIDEFIKKFN